MSSVSLALAGLAEAGIAVPNDCQARLLEHARLVREWNRAVSLVSRSDLEDLEVRHVVDSLSLAPVLVERGLSKGILLDIGSGAGFPAIPLAVVLCDLGVILVERSERKVGFLRKVTGALGLGRVRIFCGQFPKVVLDVRPDAITARAVEQAGVVLENAAAFVDRGAVFLCQAGDPREIAPGMFHVEHFAERFHVEHWEDEWSRNGLRRGDLYLISPGSATPSVP